MKTSVQKLEPFVDETNGISAASGSAKSSTFEYVTPPFDLTDKAKPLPPGRFDPIAAAERQTRQMAAGFKMWIKDDLKSLLKAYREFSKNTDNEENFQVLNHQVHTIKGNAPILDAKAAGMIACPLSTMLEGCSDHRRAKPIISLAVNAICRAIEQNIADDDAELLEFVAQLDLLNSNCLQTKLKTQKQMSDKIRHAQAAGSANNFCSDECKSGAPCPDSCAKSSLSPSS